MSIGSIFPASWSRKGSILVVAVILMALAMALIVQSSDSVNATFKQMRVKLMEQKVLAAAESVAGNHELQMINLLAAGDSFTLNTYTDTYGVQWFGDCQVKWRIEPVIVAEAKDPHDSSTQFVANPNPDPNAPLPSAPQLVNQDYYHFRIATEASYSEGGTVRCKAQAVRIVQTQLTNLFRYAIFYGQQGPAGDIEFAHGPDLSVQGGIHSNGAIYLGGSNCPTGNTATDAASIQGGGRTIIGGTGASAVTVTAYNGIYLMNKRYNYYYKGAMSGTYTGPDPNNPDPTKITDTNLIFNGTTRSINGTTITATKDSRGDVNFKTDSVAASPTGWGGWLRTNQTGAVIVTSLTNIPDFAGRPLEPQRLSNAAGILEYQRVPLFYDIAQLSQTPIPKVPGDATNSRYASNGPYLDYALGSKETGGVGRTDVSVAGAYTMHCEIWAGGVPTETVPTKVALIIRERQGGPVPVAPPGAGCPPSLPSTDPANATYATDKLAYSTYMQAHYQVFLGRLDITADFFNYPTATQVASNRLAPVGQAIPCATEDFFYNNREYFSQGTYTAATMPKQSVLTLNMDAIQDFIRNLTLNSLANWGSGIDSSTAPTSFWIGRATGGPAANGSDTIRQHFSGLIYAHRCNNTGAYSATNLPADFSNAVRFARGSEISWDHNTGTNPLGTSKITLVTPNQCFLKGDFNTITHSDSAGTSQITPVALMCDMLTVQSNSWTDTQTLGSLTGATTTTYNTALVVNNAPTTQLLKGDDASVHTFAWYLENWGGQDYYFKGSIVVLNSRRYCRGFNQGANRTGTPGTDIPPDRASPVGSLYGAPTRHITFNNDLLSQAGTPPYQPFGVSVARQVNYSYVLISR
jgi:hypothetical protein